MEKNYVNSEDIPMGFGMLLAQNQEAMARFAAFSPQQRQAVLDGAKAVRSKAEMWDYVNRIGLGPF